MKTVKLAVISDLHCHGVKEEYRESWLIAGSKRVPSNKHPVQALVDLAKRKGMKADAIVCCGDLANKISQEGMSHTWDILRADLKPALETRAIYCTIGNHDVNSRTSGGDPFEMARHIHPEFPFPDQTDRNQFWTDGFCLQNLEGLAHFLVINSVHDHYDTEKAVRGTFGDDKIAALDEYLSKHLELPVRIAILHHHPVLHSSPTADSRDVLPNGDHLLETLAKYKFSLVVHGHRHLPRISRYSANSHSFHILGAGSFSKILVELNTVTRNVFHYVELSSNGGVNAAPCGRIETWEFNLGRGWNPATLQSASLPHVVPIGPPIDPRVSDCVIEYFATQPDAKGCDGPQIDQHFPSLRNLLPDELETIRRQLGGKAGLKIETDPDTGLVAAIWRIHDPKV